MTGAAARGSWNWHGRSPTTVRNGPRERCGARARLLLGIRDSAANGSAVDITSTVDAIPPLPEDFDPAAAVLTAGA